MIVDNNILSSLAKIDELGLLDHLFDDVGTPPSVVGELHNDEVAGYEFVSRVDDIKTYHGGWLHVLSLSEGEIQLAEEVVDASLSFTDAECIAVAQSRDRPLLTDDSHVGEIASQRGIVVWDLKLLLGACVHRGHLQTESELENIITELRERDHYRFSADDRADLFDQF